MTDTIQEWLRRWARGEWVLITDQDLVLEAADEIDRLGRELDKPLDHERTLSCGHTWTLRHTACPVCFEELKRELDEWRNREASCCPEDVPFEDVIAAKNKRIEELEEDVSAFGHGLIELGVNESAHIITDDQINAAWEKLMLGNKASDMAIGYEQALMDLGIIACPKCGGTKRVPTPTTYFLETTIADEPCTCPHNGWVVKGGDDE